MRPFLMFGLAIWLFALVGCGGSTAAAPVVAPVNDPTGLLIQYGWTINGTGQSAPFTVPPQGNYDQPTQRLLDASKTVGLDFSPLAGKDLRVQIFPLNETSKGGQPVNGHVLMNGKDVVGAWLSVGEQVYALNAKP